MTDAELDRLRKKVALLVRGDGVRKTSAALGVGPEALAKFVANLPVRAGTIALIAQQAAKIQNGRT